MSSNLSFIEELRQRNVFRVATVYAVASWVILQLADVIFPAIGLPDTAIRYVLLGLVILAPAVLVFAWYFEVTPGGLRLSGHVVKEESITQQTGRRIDFIIIVLLSLALAFFMYKYFSEDTIKPDPPVQKSLEQKTTLNIQTPIPTATNEPQDLRPSVAVLPFVNMSSDKENEHFSDGLSEELLNVLAQMHGLRVVGRTSSFYYKGKNENLKNIGEALNVNNILEGSVRKSGNKIRITAQLISAYDGFHLWSKTFDREITDIFAIQDEISKEVAAAMKITLLNDGVTLPESRLTGNPEAHDLYLRAKEALYRRTEDSILLAIDLFNLSAKLDPEYAPPLLGIADATMILQNNYQTITLHRASEIAKSALDKAANLEFYTSDYWATLGLYHHHLARHDGSHYKLSIEAYQKSLELNENNVNAYLWYSTLLNEDLSQDNDDLSLALINKATMLDPLNRVASANYQQALATDGRESEALANLDRLMKLDPEYPYFAVTAMMIHAQNARWIEATKLFATMPRNERFYAFGPFFILQNLGDESLLPPFFDAIATDNPALDFLRASEEGMLATPVELVTKAKVFLLQPDSEGIAISLMFRMLELGEFQLAKELILNISPRLADDISTIQYDGFNLLPQLMVAFHFTDEQAHAKKIAEFLLNKNKDLRSVGLINKGLQDAASYVVLGDKERAIAEIERAYAQGWRSYYGDRVDKNPIFAAIINEESIEHIKQNIDIMIDEQRPLILDNLKSAGVF